MPKLARPYVNKAAILALVSLGVLLLVVSVYSSSSLLAVFWVALTFFGAILVYATPGKHVPFDILYDDADANSCNIERIINCFNLSLKGIYLPPANLPNSDSSLVFVPRKSEFLLPSADELADSFVTKSKDGVLIIPPGVALCRLFERELKVSFASLDMSQLKADLPRLLVEELGLAKGFEMSINGNVVDVDIRENVLDRGSLKKMNLPRTHECVGSALTSAIACALAKTARVPVMIKSETRLDESKTERVTFELFSSGLPSAMDESSKGKLAVDFPKVALPRAPGKTVSSAVSALDLTRPLRVYLVVLLAVALVADVSVWFVGWRLYDALKIWQFLPNIDFLNLLALGMAVASIMILSAGRFIRKLAANSVYGWFSLLGLVAGLAAAVWSGGWLLYARFQLPLNSTIYEGLMLGVIALVSVVLILARRPKV